MAAYVSDSEWDASGALKVLGLIEAYVCRSCGYTELCTRAPRKIPHKKIKGAKLLKGNQSPYR